jgi:hypothetical protein
MIMDPRSYLNNGHYVPQGLNSYAATPFQVSTRIAGYGEIQRASLSEQKDQDYDERLLFLPLFTGTKLIQRLSDPERPVPRRKKIPGDMFKIKAVLTKVIPLILLPLRHLLANITTGITVCLPHSTYVCILPLGKASANR